MLNAIRVEFSHESLTFRPLSWEIKIFSHVKLCLATAIHNFKWLKIRVICNI